MSERSPLQQQVWDACHGRKQARAETAFDHRCEDCKMPLLATRARARELGWRKRWRRKHGGLRVQVDLCPKCKGAPNGK